MQQNRSPGWYGKMRALGDFSSRRLPSQFITFWDTWLQESIMTSRSQLGENWLNLYLNCPIWRFILMPNLCNNQIWTGILMPSVDKVGRYFPLTIALSFTVQPGTLLSIITARNWFTALEQLALKSLEADFSPECLDQYLLKHPFPLTRMNLPFFSDSEFIHFWNTDYQAESTLNNKIELPAADDMVVFFTHMMEYQFTKAGSHKSIWWREFPKSKKIQLQCFTGLPAKDQFIALLN